jgi:hypothetical protein
MRPGGPLRDFAQRESYFSLPSWKFMAIVALEPNHVVPSPSSEPAETLIHPQRLVDAGRAP